VARWYALPPGAVLVCEDNEDIDTYLRIGAHEPRVVEEQIKILEGSVTARTPAVDETLANFVRAFHHHLRQGRNCRLVFTTSTTIGRQTTDPTEAPASIGGRDNTQIAIDVLREWRRWAEVGATSEGRDEASTALVNEIRGVLTRYFAAPALSVPPHTTRRRPPLPTEALAYFDAAPERWKAFLDAVEWNLGWRRFASGPRTRASASPSGCSSSSRPSSPTTRD
jgi:hypothetical protein